MKWARRLLAVVATLAQVTVFAGMMQASVPVASHSQAALDKVLPAALTQVLAKVSGNASVATLPAVQNQLKNANAMVKSFSYSMVSNAMDPTAPPVLMADITFDQNAITQLLSASGQPVWGKDRPKTLVWLDVVDGLNNNIIASTDSTTSPLAALLTDDAQTRGLALMFPVNDLTDQTNLTDTPSNLFNQEQVIGASKRYGMNSILVGQVVKTATGFSAHWQYTLDGAPIEWTDQAASLDKIAGNAVNSMAASMVSQLAMSSLSRTPSTIDLAISGISNLSAYVKVQAFLRSMKMVNAVSLKGISNSAMTVTVEYVGQEQALEQSLNASHLLAPEQSEVAFEMNQPTLNYHWQGGMS